MFVAVVLHLECVNKVFANFGGSFSKRNSDQQGHHSVAFSVVQKVLTERESAIWCRSCESANFPSIVK